MNPETLYLNTLYYTTSTIAQVVAAVGAVAVALSFFRVTVLLDYLIGDGRATQHRWGDEGYKLSNVDEHYKQRDRLRDAIERKNKYEIRAVLVLLRDQEIEEGFTKESRPTGLQDLFERFTSTEREIKRLIHLTTMVGVFSVASIVFAVVSMASASLICSASCDAIRRGTIWINILLFIGVIVSATCLGIQCLSENTRHERDRRDRSGC